MVGGEEFDGKGFPPVTNTFERCIQPTGVVVAAGPVVVSVLEYLEPISPNVREHLPPDAIVVAVGSLLLEQNDMQEPSSASIITVGSSWAYPLRRGLQVVQCGRDEMSFILPTASGNSFIVSLPPRLSDSELKAWLAILEAVGCNVDSGMVPNSCAAAAADFLGHEWDKSSADEIMLESVLVHKGGSACVCLVLDERGWFYWLGSGGRKQRTRPRWKETNCVVCRRAATGKEIQWECYHVPELGDTPGAAKLALAACKASCAEASKAKWEARKDAASLAALFSLQGIAAAGPVVAEGVRLLGRGASFAVEVVGEGVAATVPQVDQPITVDPDVHAVACVVRDASVMGTGVVDAVSSVVKEGATMIGQEIAVNVRQSNDAHAAREMLTAEDEAERSGCDPFIVQIDMSTSSSPGLILDAADACFLSITAIDPGGMVDLWNGQSIGRKVYASDRIIQVNSVKDDATGMLQELDKHQVTTMVVEPCTRHVQPNAAPDTPGPRKRSEELGEAFGAAIASMSRVFSETAEAKSRLSKSAATATCAIAGARYGREVGDTLGIAIEGAGAARDFHAGAGGLRNKKLAQTVVVHCASGIAAGPDADESGTDVEAIRSGDQIKTNSSARTEQAVSSELHPSHVASPRTSEPPT